MKTWTKGIVAGLLAGVVTLGSLPAVAGPYNSIINRVEMEQEQRIQQGLYSGRLTPGEFRRLENQQARISRHRGPDASRRPPDSRGEDPARPDAGAGQSGHLPLQAEQLQASQLQTGQLESGLPLILEKGGPGGDLPPGARRAGRLVYPSSGAAAHETWCTLGS